MGATACDPQRTTRGYTGSARSGCESLSSEVQLDCRSADLKIPVIDKVLSVMSFLNGTGASVRVYEGISAVDLATMNQVNVH